MQRTLYSPFEGLSTEVTNQMLNSSLMLQSWDNFNPLTPVVMCHNVITLKHRMTHLGVIMEHVKFELVPGTTKLEQQPPLQGYCSDVRAFTRCTCPVFPMPAWRTIRWYHAGTVFLNESSHSHLCAREYT